MVDQSIRMNVNDTLELDYLVEEVSDSVVSFNKNPNGKSDTYVSRNSYIFDPNGTGTYEFDLKGQTIEIEVTDIPDSGVARWTFDDADTQSGTAIDTWNSNVGTINGATTGISGQYNQAYSFDGVDDVVTATIANFDIYSVSLWVKPEDDISSGINDAQQGLVSKDNGSDGFFAGWLDDNGALRFGTNNGNIKSSKKSWSSSVWTMVTLVQESASQAYIYVDDAQDASGDNGYDGFDNTAFEVGGREHRGRYYAGGIDDVRVYDTALSATEVSNLYNTGSIFG
jgi:hypothetical protein